MSCYISPNTVNDGLVLYLDAANTKCYPGTGNNVSDISSSKTSFQLFDSAGYIASESVFRFVYQSSGTATNWITTSTFSGITSGVINSFTYCGFYKVTDSNSVRGWTFDDFNSDTSNRLNFYPTVNGASAEINNDATNIPPSLSGLSALNIWVYYGYSIADSGTTHTIFRWNFNTKSFDFNPKTLPAVATIGTSVIFGRRGAATSNFCGLDVGPQMLYNRALSAEEIQQNFNAIRGRYGI